METRGIVTPEGVVLDFEVAGLASRVLARLLDVLVYGVITFGLFLLVVWLFVDNQTAAISISILLGFVGLLVMPIAVETSWRGKTVGKAALGLRAVTDKGGPAGFRHAAIRSTVGLVELFATSGIVAVAVALFSERTQRLGDMAAGVIVVRERLVGAKEAPRLPLEALLARHGEYAASLEVRGLGDDTLLLARQALRRASTLGLDGRAQLMSRVAALVESEIGVPRPERMAAEVYLAAVVHQAGAGAHAAALRAGGGATRVPDAAAAEPPPTWADFSM